MDIPVENKTWSASDLGFFAYEERKAVVLGSLEGEEITRHVLYTKEDWEKWFNSSPGISPNWEKKKPGLYVVLCSRAPPVFGNKPGPVQYLPFTRNIWERLTREFHISRSIRRTIARLVPCYSSVRDYDEMSGKLMMSFTARMSSKLSGDVGMSTAYIPSTGSAFAVIYGCNDDQMEDVEKRIRRASAQLRHPLLTPGILAELERKRLVEAVEDLLDQFTLRSERLDPTLETSWSPDSDIDGKKTQEHLSLCLRSRSLIDHIQAVKRQLAKLLDDFDVVAGELESLHSDGQLCTDGTTAAALTKVGNKMKTRIEDIMIEYDDKIDDCNMMICNTSLAMQTVWNHIARQDSKTNTKISHANAAIAVQTKHESTQMRTIALLTMAYLPLSSVAAIFSMDMFNWGAVEGESIVSKHIWLFAVLAVGLTIVTVFAWYLGTRQDKEMKEKSDIYFSSPQRTDTTEYV
ncbi:hypothetical protein EsH8_II_001544 [Colletotrichum jinshuiense]